MKNKLMRLTDKLLARKRAIIETIIDQLKNISQIEHSRHRSPVNFCINVWLNRLLPSAEEALAPIRLGFTRFGLTRTDVILRLCQAARY